MVTRKEVKYIKEKKSPSDFQVLTLNFGKLHRRHRELLAHLIPHHHHLCHVLVQDPSSQEPLPCRHPRVPTGRPEESRSPPPRSSCLGPASCSAPRVAEAHLEAVGAPPEAVESPPEGAEVTTLPGEMPMLQTE